MSEKERQAETPRGPRIPEDKEEQRQEADRLRRAEIPNRKRELRLLEAKERYLRLLADNDVESADPEEVESE